MKKTMAEQFIDDQADDWEDGHLGTEIDYAAVSNSVNEAALDEALCLQSINIRMPKSLLDDLKAIATLENIGYQPLMKQVLQRFVTCEMKRIVREEAEKIEARKVIQERIETQEAEKRRA